MKGHVLFFEHTYGFIRSPECDVDIYFYFKDIVSEHAYKELFPGDYVEFEYNKEGEKHFAKNIRQIKESEDGKKILRVRVFTVTDNKFEVMDFYKEIVSRVHMGLRHAVIANNGGVIIALSHEVNQSVIDFIADNSDVGEIETDEYIIKFV